MVATYVEIVYGIRISDKDACKIFFKMSDEEYNQRHAELDGIGVFADANYVIPYKNETVGDMVLRDVKIYQRICCSNTTDVVVGIPLRKLYRVSRRCDQCDKYTLCMKCFSSTEQGVIDYTSTNEFGECDPKKICGRCYSYNAYDNEECHVCSFEMIPFEDRGRFMKRSINKILGNTRTPKLYFHWNDCSSCT